MKKLIACGLLLGSLSATAQSYLILNNGVMLTTDRAGYIYDFSQFILPYDVTVNGGQFLVEKEKLVTIDESGYKYDKDLKVKKIKGKGLNYLLNSDSELITVDTKGFFYKFEENDVFDRVEKFGGSFFTAKDAKKKNVLLYTINSAGNYFNITLPELNPADIAVFGGSYFVTKNGVAFTVNKDGFVFAKTEKIAAAKKLGGNFLIDINNKLFTVSDTGILANPVLPATLKVSNINKIGANYMLDTEGRLFVVDNNGNVFERTIGSHDLRNVKVISL